MWSLGISQIKFRSCHCCIKENEDGTYEVETSGNDAIYGNNSTYRRSYSGGVFRNMHVLFLIVCLILIDPPLVGEEDRLITDPTNLCLMTSIMLVAKAIIREPIRSLQDLY